MIETLEKMIKDAMDFYENQQYEKSLEFLLRAQRLANENSYFQYVTEIDQLIDTVKKASKIAREPVQTSGASKLDEIDTLKSDIHGIIAGDDSPKSRAISSPQEDLYSSHSKNDSKGYYFDIPSATTEQKSFFSSVSRQASKVQESEVPSEIDINAGIVLKRNQIANFLQQQGYSVEFDYKTGGMAGEIDLVAKRRRKKTIFLVFATTPGDAGISSFLLRSLTEKGRKVIFLISGGINEVQTTGDITVIKQIETLDIS